MDMDMDIVQDAADQSIAGQQAVAQVEMLQYMKQAAALVEISLHPDYQPGIVANLERLKRIASLVLEFPLPDDIEAAPQFHP
jgi:hypothetical protein